MRLDPTQRVGREGGEEGAELRLKNECDRSTVERTAPAASSPALWSCLKRQWETLIVRVCE